MCFGICNVNEVIRELGDYIWDCALLVHV